MSCDINLRRWSDSSGTNHLQSVSYFVIKVEADAFALVCPLVRITRMIASRFKGIFRYVRRRSYFRDRAARACAVLYSRPLLPIPVCPEKKRGILTRRMTAIAFDFALLARLAAHTQLLAFALRAALPAGLLSTLIFSSAPDLMVVFTCAGGMVRHFGCAIGTGIMVRSDCAVRCRHIHGGTRRLRACSLSVNSGTFLPRDVERGLLLVYPRLWMLVMLSYLRRR